MRCPWHKWEFDIASRPCLVDEQLRVRRYAVHVEGDEIVVSLDQPCRRHDHSSHRLRRDTAARQRGGAAPRGEYRRACSEPRAEREREPGREAVARAVRVDDSPGGAAAVNGPPGCAQPPSAPEVVTTSVGRGIEIARRGSARPRPSRSRSARRARRRRAEDVELARRRRRARARAARRRARRRRRRRRRRRPSSRARATAAGRRGRAGGASRPTVVIVRSPRSSTCVNAQRCGALVGRGVHDDAARLELRLRDAGRARRRRAP